MKKYNLIPRVTLILVCMGVFTFIFPLNTLANPDTQEVLPTDHDFGDVEVGTIVSTIITMTNINGSDVTVFGLGFQAESSADFSLWVYPSFPFDLDLGETVEVEVAFHPSDAGYVAAVLEIESTDSVNPLQEVFFDGVGVDTQPSPGTIEEILAFFDAEVEAGTIEGTGPRDAKTNHQKVFKFKLLMVAFFLESEATREACTLLWHAYEQSDGQSRPMDFIEGDKVPELNSMILELWTNLGCE